MKKFYQKIENVEMLGCLFNNYFLSSRAEIEVSYQEKIQENMKTL